MSNLKGSYDDSYLLATTKKEKLQALQRDAYYNVLHAFNAEDLDFSEERVTIVSDLNNEWGIGPRIHRMLENRVKDQPLYQYLRKKQENPTLAEVLSEDPESLVDQWIRIRLPDEDEFTAFHVKEYNEREGTHHLMSAYSITTEYDDPCDWVDIRLFPEEDIDWAEEPSQGRRRIRVRRRVIKPKQGRNLYEEAILRRASIVEEARKEAEAQAAQALQ